MRTSSASRAAGAVFLSAGPEETRRLGADLASFLEGGEVIHLIGGLGAGKTCFVQGLGAGLGGAAAVSPTFTLVNEYHGRIPLCHVDLYRLERPREVEELGLEEYYGRGVVAIEWADRLPLHLRRPSLEVVFSADSPRGRKLAFRAFDAGSARVLRLLASAGGAAARGATGGRAAAGRGKVRRRNPGPG